MKGQPELTAMLCHRDGHTRARLPICGALVISIQTDPCEFAYFGGQAGRWGEATTRIQKARLGWEVLKSWRRLCGREQSSAHQHRACTLCGSRYEASSWLFCRLRPLE